MRHLNIHLFKVIFPDGITVFESKNKDGRGSGGFTTIKTTASQIKSEIEDF